MVTRYNRVDMVECDNGAWVLWRQHADEVADLREQIAALESREVCAAAHENVETCGYCQRDELIRKIRAVIPLIYPPPMPVSLDPCPKCGYHFCSANHGPP